MKRTEYTIAVKLDARTFRRFCFFDTLKLRKRWVRPVVFALILIAFAVIALLSGKEQAGMIAAVLLAVGLGLPLVYFGSFLSSVNLQVANHKLDKPRRVYTVVLNADGVQATNDQITEAPVRLPWKEVQAAFRAKGCIYLYVNAARAFLLPDGQANVPDAEVWEYLKEHMGGKCRF